MGTTPSAPVSRLPALAFTCSVCFEDKGEEHYACHIDLDPVCIDCVKDDIIPQFYAALEHQANYPVKWADKALSPVDFADFFEDFPGLMWKWSEKAREYETSGKNRVYCKCCEAFVGDRTLHATAVVLCLGCRNWVCSRCGHSERVHECKINEDDDGTHGVDGITKCPRGCLIALQDGCNDVICRCGAHLCAVCGEADPPRSHWSRGSSCPRFGHPGDERVQFNKDVFEDEGTFDEEELDDDENPDNEQREVEWAVDTHIQIVWLLSLRPSDPDDELQDRLELIDQNLEETQAALSHIPWAQQALEEGQEDALFLSERLHGVSQMQTQVLREHQQQMQYIVQNWRDVEVNLREKGLLDQRPMLALSLRDTAADVLLNLDLYVQLDTVRDAYSEFQRRHGRIMDFIQSQMPEAMLQLMPETYRVLSVYELVGPYRLRAMAASLEVEEAGSSEEALDESVSSLDSDSSDDEANSGESDPSSKDSDDGFLAP